MLAGWKEGFEGCLSFRTSLGRRICDKADRL